ncbi:hypothetical protein SLEP1_g36783 [Rubroshorea leprosula]|uniref:Uncharacterized protein n=1 Tax=Rubroshorea leprosula TaxID=152421 RepID=A0AAV5KSL0_9ROSI|nr:hypothetical protein SLEP1_g36783 [Rubroshorea leprosula]
MKKPGSKVPYLGAGSGITVSHIFDIVGPTRVVCAVESSHESGRDLVNVAKRRTNVVPIIGDVGHRAQYRTLVGMVDVIFSDISYLNQVCLYVPFFFFHKMSTVCMHVSALDWPARVKESGAGNVGLELA